MSRAEHDALVRQAQMLARRYDVWAYHASNPVRDAPGLPDLLLLGTVTGIAREVKTGRGVLSAGQADVGRRLALAGISFDVWRPEDLDSGRIEREIASCSGRRPWTAPAATPAAGAMATPAQIRALHAEFAEHLDYRRRSDRPERLAAAAAALGLPELRSLTDLTTGQAGHLIRTLRSGALDTAAAGTPAAGCCRQQAALAVIVVALMVATPGVLPLHQGTPASQVAAGPQHQQARQRRHL